MIKKIFTLGKTILSSNHHKQQFLCIQSSRYYFCQANQAIEQLKNQLHELNHKYYELQDYDARLETMNEVMKLKAQIHQQLYLGKENEKKQYEGYLRDKLVIAQLKFENDKKEECDQLLQEILQSNLENELIQNKDENQGFLAAFYVLHTMANVDKLSIAEQSAEKGVQYLQYFVENHCPIYQKSCIDQIPDQNLSIESELQHLQNLISHLMIYSKISQERGKLNDSISHLGQAATILDNLGHLFRKLFAKQIVVKNEMSEEDLKRFFMHVLISEAITLKNLAKSCSQLRRYEDTQNLLDAAFQYFEYLIEQKLLAVHDENYVATLIQKYALIKQINGDTQELIKIKTKLDEIVKNLKENENTIYSLLRYQIFLNQYYDSDINVLNDLMSKLKGDVPAQLEFHQARLQVLMQKGDAKNALEQGKTLFNILQTYFDASHYLYGETLLTMLELSIILKDFLQAKQFIVQLSSESHNIVYIKDLQQIIKLELLRIEFLEKIEQQVAIEQLSTILAKIELIAFTNFSDSFKKSRILSQFYSLINNKEKVKEKLQECLNILQQDLTFPSRDTQLKQIEDNLSQLK